MHHAANGTENFQGLFALLCDIRHGQSHEECTKNENQDWIPEIEKIDWCWRVAGIKVEGEEKC
jgi:hypothetical protein